MGFTLNRRDFLRTSAFSVGLAGMIRLRAPAYASVQTGGALQVLAADEADLLAAIVERMVFNGEPEMPAVRETSAVAVIDQALLQADEVIRDQVGWLLWLFDWGPAAFDLQFARFRSLGDDAKDAYIRGWAESRFELRRMGFQALKNLSMLGYYAQDATWKGIHYDGPWTKKPRSDAPDASEVSDQ